MIRTRDFLLFLVLVLLLLGGITTTMLRDQGGEVPALLTSHEQMLGAALVHDHYEVAEADVRRTSELSSEERLAAMRERVQVYRENTTINQQRFVVRDAEPETIVATQTDGVATANAPQSLQRCREYQNFAGFWPAHVVIEEHEGARLVIDQSQTVDTAATPETSLFSGSILVQLPIPQLPSGDPTCVASDVVGIALDGSLIRNSDHQAYGFFDAKTVVGYALDGFPIYGRDDAVNADQCGGTNGAMGYGYVLQHDRSAVLNCFSGRPAAM